jgi:hypothetical protein
MVVGGEEGRGKGWKEKEWEEESWEETGLHNRSIARPCS